MQSEKGTSKPPDGASDALMSGEVRYHGKQDEPFHMKGESIQYSKDDSVEATAEHSPEYDLQTDSDRFRGGEGARGEATAVCSMPTSPSSPVCKAGIRATTQSPVTLSDGVNSPTSPLKSPAVSSQSASVQVHASTMQSSVPGSVQGKETDGDLRLKGITTQPQTQSPSSSSSAPRIPQQTSADASAPPQNVTPSPPGLASIPQVGEENDNEVSSVIRVESSEGLADTSISSNNPQRETQEDACCGNFGETQTGPSDVQVCG
jgi:hypothetical protein